MPAPTHLSALAPLIEMLVETDVPADRDRILIDAPLYLGIAPAAALWRPAAPRRGAPPQWHPILARGPSEALPGKDQVLAVVGGHLPGELPEGRRVLVAGSGRASCALVLGGVLSSEEGTDLLEALLIAATAIEEASAAPASASSGSHASLIDRVAAPLPASSGEAGTSEAFQRLCHDVRNHLASIRTTQELLTRYEDRLNDDEREHFREVLEREVRRASGLLVQAVHPETEDDVPPADRAGCERPGEVLGDVVAAERAACVAAGVELVLVVEAGAEELTCALDELSLARLVRNLLVNARQALDHADVDEPRIEVRVDGVVADDGPWLSVCVQDNGPGIPKDDLHRVWSSGFTSGKPGGHGFGLSVVHDLTASVGGAATARNVTPNGVVFELRLPPAPTRG